MSFYKEHILDHYKNPRNVGEIDGGLTARDTNPLCGDEITVFAVIDEQLKELKHQPKGCAVTVASASILSEKLLGRSAKMIEDLTERDVMDILGISLTPARIKCAMLPVWTLQQALRGDGNEDS